MMKASDDPAHVSIARPRAWAERLWMLGAFVTVALELAHLPHALQGLHWVVAPVAMSAWLIAGVISARSRQLNTAQVRVGAAGITFASGETIARAALASGELTAFHGTFLVRVRARSGALVELHAGSLQTALEWLDTLGLGVSRRVVTFDGKPERRTRSRSELRAQDVAMALALAAYPLVTGPLTAALALSGVIGLLLRSRGYVQLRVGADGIEEMGGGERRFHSFDDVIAAVVERDEVVLRKRDRSHVVLRVTDRADETSALHRRAVVAVIEQALRQREPAREGAAAQLAARGEDAQAWASTLGVQPSGDAYRHAPLDADVISAVLADPHADARARVAAARLVAERDDTARATVLEVAQRTAHPRVRVALEAAADRDDEALRRLAAELPDAPDAAVEPRRARGA